MIIIGIILSVFAIGFFCWLLFTLAVYALPVFIGITAGFAAYHHGYGIGTAIVIAFASGIVTLLIGQLALSVTRIPILRAGIALVFALPAGIAGYFATLGIAHLCVSSGALAMALAVTGGVLVFGTAWMRMTMFGPPRAGQGFAEERRTRTAQRPVSSDRPPNLVLDSPYRRSRGSR
jgi:hypothetical protein